MTSARKTLRAQDYRRDELIAIASLTATQAVVATASFAAYLNLPRLHLASLTLGTFASVLTGVGVAKFIRRQRANGGIR